MENSNGTNEYDAIKAQDAEIYDALMGEVAREARGVELIPSENYVSKAVLQASGSIFTNKYSEGYPGKRYYGGQTYTDIVETLAIERANSQLKSFFARSIASVSTISVYVCPP